MAETQETARIKIKELSSKNPATRRAAAYYLGEAGVDEAITKLVTVYKNDPDSSVRKAAQYALGMFKAVEVALQRGEDQKVVKLLRQVVDENKLGKRLPTPAKVLVRFELLLLLTLVVLLALHFVLPDLGPLPGGIELPRLIGTDQARVVQEAQLAYTEIANDAQTLQHQFQNVIGGGQPDCAAFFNDTAPYVLPADVAARNARLAAAVTQLNEAHASIAAAKQRFDENCDGVRPIEVAEVGGLLGSVLAVQRSLPEIEAVLNAPDEPPPAPAVTATAEVTEPPPTARPTAVPTPTVSVPLANPRAHLVPLYNIIDRVRDPRGANGLLRQYWRDANVAGATDVCSDPRSEIPADYAAPQIDVQASPDLAEAINQVNLGLSLVRQGWDLLASACADRNFSGRAATGVQLAETAQQAFQVADDALMRVRNNAS